MKKRVILVAALSAMLAVTAACGSGKTTEDSATGNDVSGSLVDSKVVKLGNYKNIEVEPMDTEVTDEELQEEIDSLLSYSQESQPVEGRTIVEDGDTVAIDYVGKMDGEAFDGGTGSYDLTIGSGAFIDGFEDGLIGKEVGGTYELNLTFPDPYENNPDLAGEPVVFEVTVNNILEYITPEWTDEFVQNNTEYDSIEAYMEGTREALAETKAQSAQSERESTLLQAIIDDSEFEIGETDLQDLKESLMENVQESASYYGMELADYLSYFGMTEDEFEEEALEAAESQLKQQLVIEAIAEAEDLGLTEDEYQEKLEALAEEEGADSAESFEEAYSREEIEEYFLYQKVMEFVSEQAVEV